MPRPGNYWEMSADASLQSLRTEGLTPTATRALELFARDARRSYGDDLQRIVLFGSRARGDAGPDSDVDVAVVLRDIRDRVADRNRLAESHTRRSWKPTSTSKRYRSPKTNGIIRISIGTRT